MIGVFLVIYFSSSLNLKTKNLNIKKHTISPDYLIKVEQCVLKILTNYFIYF